MSERVWNILVDSFMKILIPGLTITIPLTLISFAIALVIAIVVAMIQVAKVKVLKDLCRFYVWIIRGTPILVQLYVVFYGLPSLGIMVDAFPSALIVFAINTGAYASETMRAAIESVDKGQIEAGYCVGMTYMQIMMRIVLPQALRTAFPSLFNILISLVKDTSLASSITVVEMLRATQRIIARTYEAFYLYLEVGLIYLIFCTVLTKLQTYGEKRLASYGGQKK
ncbi:MAG: amino acid ABC transporter permease [Erysipelotrichaceae bacterium]|nr:amino acid ABC transporter permease [Erysipelotrichaceae bacterium]